MGEEILGHLEVSPGMRLSPVVTSEPALVLILAVGWSLVRFVGQGRLVSVAVATFMRALRGRSAERSNAVETGWAGACLFAVMGMISVTWLAAGSTHAGDDASSAGNAAVHGRVLDDAGKPVAGARVRLYRREGRWERRHPVIDEATAGPDGSFRLKSRLEPIPESRSRGLAPYVLLADHPGKAVGWRIIPGASRTFAGDIVLTERTERVIAVVDAAGRPVPGAKIEAYGVGDPSSASRSLQEPLEIRPGDGPLTAVTDANGNATLGQLPRTNASFVATKPGFAEGYAFREQGTIRLTPSAALSGTITAPDGKPLEGLNVVLFTSFMWAFEHAMTDSKGRYQFDDLKARGWDMSAGGPMRNLATARTSSGSRATGLPCPHGPSRSSRTPAKPSTFRPSWPE